MTRTEQIKQILSTLERIWLDHPSLRLGQIIEGSVLSARPAQITGTDIAHCVFYVEDEDLQDGLYLYEMLFD